MNLLSKLRTPSKRERPEATLPVQWLGGGYFFTLGERFAGKPRFEDVQLRIARAIETQSPLPLDQTAWAYQSGQVRKGGTHVFAYAAPRETLFLRESDARVNGPVLPGFLALSQLRFERPTWVFLSEVEGLTAVLLRPGEPVPARVVGRFFSSRAQGSDQPWTLRETLLAGDTLHEIDDKGRTGLPDCLPGILRIEHARWFAGKDLLEWSLELQKTPETPWEEWKTFRKQDATFWQAADLRDRVFLEETHQKRRQLRFFKTVGVAFAVALTLLVFLEALLGLRSRQASQLRETVRTRQPAVNQAQEIESMNQAITVILNESFRPLDWLMAAGRERPEAVSFASFSFEKGGQLLISGQATEVSQVNAYFESLRADSRFADVLPGQVTSGREGVQFSLRLQPGDLAQASVEE